MSCGTNSDIVQAGQQIIRARAEPMLTLQSIIVIAVGWSAIYWRWTDTRLAAIIGFVLAYLVTVAVLAVRGHEGVR
jgi:hypothetical protein